MVTVVGMAQGELTVHLVRVPTTVAGLAEIASGNELADDVRHRSLRDADGLGDVPQPGSWVRGDALEYVGVVRHEAKRLTTIYGS